MRITNIVRSYLPVFGLLLSTALTIPTLALGALEGAYDNDGAGPSDASGVGQTADDNLEYDPDNQKADEICDPDVNRRSDSADCKELKSENVSEDIMNAYFDTLSNAATMGIEVDSVKTMQAIQDGKIHTGQVIDKGGKVQTVSPGSSIDGTGGLRDINNTDWNLYNQGQPEGTSDQKSTEKSSIGLDELLGKDREFDTGGLRDKADTGSERTNIRDGLSSDTKESEDTVSDTSIETGSGFLPGEFKRDVQYSRATELDYENLFKATDGKVDDWVKDGKLDQKIAIEAGMIGLAHGADLSKVPINGISPADIDKYGYIDPMYDTGVNVDSSLLNNSSKYNNAAFAKMLDKQIAPDLFSSSSMEDRAQLAMSYFVNVTERYSPNTTAGIIGNMVYESELEQLRDATGKENSTGLMQANASVKGGQRRQSLEEFAGQKFTGFYKEEGDDGKEYWRDGPGAFTQLAFVDAELQGISTRFDAGAKRAGEEFAKNPNMSATEAAAIFQNYYERPKDRTGSLKIRQGSAEKILASYTSFNGVRQSPLNRTASGGQTVTTRNSSGGQIGERVPRTGITAIDNTVSRLLTNGNVSIPSFGNFGSLFQTVQGIAGSLQNLFGRGGSGNAQNNNQPGANTQDQPYTDLGGVIQSDLTSKATLAMATSTQGYQFWGSMKRSFLNNGNSDNYTGSSLINDLIIDYYCDGSIDSKKSFSIPYSVLANSAQDVIIASQMTVILPGLHCFAFDVDTNNDLPEINENNNLSNWMEFLSEPKANATTTDESLPELNFEVAVYETDGALSTDWTDNNIVIEKGDQIAFRWNAPDYDICMAFIPTSDNNIFSDPRPANRNTLDENMDVIEHTGYFSLECVRNSATRVASIYVKVDADTNLITDNQNGGGSVQYPTQGKYVDYSIPEEDAPDPPPFEYIDPSLATPLPKESDTSPAAKPDGAVEPSLLTETMSAPEKLTYEEAVGWLALHYQETSWSWKDKQAAEKLGINGDEYIEKYVIRGMDPKLVVLAAAAGKQMENDGINFRLTSGFRDDYRQSLITSGTRASVGTSWHGGSKVTKGFGDGKAFDISGADAQAWMDTNGSKFGLARPYGSADAPHIALASSGEVYNRKGRIGGMSPSAVDAIYKSVLVAGE